MILARAFQALVAAPVAVFRLPGNSPLSVEFHSRWMGAGLGIDARPTELEGGGPDDAGITVGELTETARCARTGLDENSVF